MSSDPPMSAGIIAPPPVLYLGAFMIGFIVHAFSPQPILVSDPVRQGLGVLLLVGLRGSEWASAAAQSPRTLVPQGFPWSARGLILTPS